MGRRDGIGRFENLVLTTGEVLARVEAGNEATTVRLSSTVRRKCQATRSRFVGAGAPTATVHPFGQALLMWRDRLPQLSRRVG